MSETKVFLEQEDGVYIKNPVVSMLNIIEFCKEMVEIFTDTNGEEDEDTKVAKDALDDAERVLAYFKNYTDFAR